MNIADFIFKFLTDKGVDTVFMISGGQAMFLNDAVCRNKKLKQVICNHHEQAAGMAADAYGRITGKVAVALVTAGPGSINITNGLVGGWTDSAPMIVISGQSNLSCVQYQEKNPIRQYGIQGINIRPYVEKATKFFATVDDPKKILYYLQKAYHLALSGRPGPVWLDVPLDIQKMEVQKGRLKEYIIQNDEIKSDQLKKEVRETLKLLKSSKRPILLVGQGVRLAGAVPEFAKCVKNLNIPVLTSRLGIDLINSDNPLYVGRPGNYGERSANLAVQNADLIISVGCRLASALVGHNPKSFGKHAKKVVVDVDQEELNKPGVEIDYKIRCDAKRFFAELLNQSAKVSGKNNSKWISKCNDWKNRYPVVQAEYKNEKPVNSYYFSEKLSKLADKDDTIIVDTGTCFHVVCQVWKIKKGQRFLTTGGLSSMGWWVAGTGACLANNKKRTIVVTGDGSLQMNIQEFATIKHHKLPIKIFIFNNNGYLLIRHTQKNFLDGRLFAEGPKSGVWCPDSLKIAKAYGIKGVRINSVNEVERKIKEVLEYNGPVICDVMTPEWQLIIPRVSSDKLADGTLVSKPYEDMFPYLDRKILKKEMVAEIEKE